MCFFLRNESGPETWIIVFIFFYKKKSRFFLCSSNFCIRTISETDPNVNPVLSQINQTSHSSLSGSRSLVFGPRENALRLLTRDLPLEIAESEMQTTSITKCNNPLSFSEENGDVKNDCIIEEENENYPQFQPVRHPVSDQENFFS